MNLLNMAHKLAEQQKKYKGVEIHGNSIRIGFYYRGARCREALKGIEVTKSNLAYAYKKKMAIELEIEQGRFNYRDHFPDSKRADLFSTTKRIPTVQEAIESWLLLAASRVRNKELSLYKSRISLYITPQFGDRKINDITKSEIEEWRAKSLTPNLSNKTINDIFIPLRGIFNAAAGDRLIDFNPLDHIKNLPRVHSDSADPFTKKELAKISEITTNHKNELSGFQFACWTGLRLSEWLALAWEDVDLSKRQIRISRAISTDGYAFPKTKGSHRVVDLLAPAYELLLKQRALTQLNEKVTVKTLQEDNRTYKTEEITLVFPKTLDSTPWQSIHNLNKYFFKPHLSKCKIRYRGINQARHTYASQLLTKGVAERWIAKQMGHTSIAMLEKHYGKWMNEEIPDMAERVSKLFENGPTLAPKTNQGHLSP